jgi:hypothetical protein
MRYIGDKYLFEVESTPIAKGFAFVITAIHRSSGRRSHVTNLNGILSEFDLDEDDPRTEESDWWVSTREIDPFQVRAGEMLRSKYMLKQIESTLDEDRMLGEWSNTRQEWNPENWIRLCTGA